MSGTTAITPSVTFGGQVGSIALSLLDTNFTQVATFLNNANNYSNYLVDTGAANSIVVTTPTSVTATYTAGLTIAVKVIAANTGASQINVNSLGLKNILNPDGSALTNNQMPANSVVALIYDGTQFLLVGGSPSAINIAGGTKGQVPVQSAVGTTTFMDSSFGFKNRIINGAMVIDQRNAGASQTLGVGNTYAVDRWLVGATTAAVTGQRVAGIGGYQYAFRITGGASNAGVFLTQRIESYNVSDLVSSNVTFSCVVAASAITSITWTAYYPTVTDSFGTVTQIATGTFSGITSSAQTFTATFNAGASAANGLQFTFTIGTMTSGTFTITGVQLEKGSTATSFDYRPIGTELALCQRYFTSFVGAVAYSQYGIAEAASATKIRFPMQCPVVMRSSPTFSFAGTGFVWAVDRIGSPLTSFVLDYATTQIQSISATGSSLTIGQAGSVNAGNFTNTSMSFSAEL